MRRFVLPVTALALVVTLAGAAGRDPLRAQAPVQAAGAPYLGQKPPGAVAALFAPGIVSTGLFERDVAITPDGREIYWSVSAPNYAYATIVFSRLRDGRWSPPEVVPHLADPAALYVEPAISPDGRHFYFTLSKMGRGRDLASAVIQVMDREGDGWGQPRDVGAAINGAGKQFFPSLTRSGTMYFTRETGGESDGIYRSRLVDGRYAAAERLPAQVNAGTGRYNAFVDPDERFLILPLEGRPDSRGGVDYYVVFRNPDDTWREPINLGEQVNTAGSGEYSPYVSPDGRYFFFMSSRVPDGARPASLTGTFFRDLLQRPQNGNPDIYWIDAGFIEKLANK